MSRLKYLLLVLAGSLLLSGCEFSVYKMPLPGGADVGDNPYVVTAKFPDVLDLVPQSTVKVNDVTVGKVTDITLDGYYAVVEMTINRKTKLPDNALAEIRQTSLLGEKFVQLKAPDNPSPNLLDDGDKIGLDSTSKNPEVEEVLGALSLLLNGGGVAQLKTIAQELNKALEGREGSAKSVLTQLNVFMGQLDKNKAGIVRAIDSLNGLAVSANKQRASIVSALDNLPAALKSIDKQRSDLIKMLQALDRLSSVGTQVIRASKSATIDALQQLDPVLTSLAKSGDDLVEAFNVALTYPFVDETVGRDPQVARNLHMGDYTNLSIQLDIDLGGPGGGNPLPPVLPGDLDPGVILGDVASCLLSANLSSAACKRVLAAPQKLLKLQSECKKAENKNNPVCMLLNLGGGGLPTLPGLSTLSNLSGGLGRAGPAYGQTGNRVTLGALESMYDPVLVRLLVPGVAQ